MKEQKDIAAQLTDPDTIRDGMRLIAENWRRSQQWEASHLSDEPVSTTISLGSLAFKEPAPTEAQVHVMLNAAVGENGFATPEPYEQNAKTPTPPLWHVEFDSLEAREAFVAKMEKFKAPQQKIEINPTRTKPIASPGREVGLAH